MESRQLAVGSWQRGLRTIWVVLFHGVVSLAASAQNDPPCFFSESFDGPSIPAGWDIGAQVQQFDNTGTPLGTYVDAWTIDGVDTANANGNFPVPFRVGHGNFIMANDDASECDCDMLDVRLTSPVIDLTSRVNTAVECNVFLDQNFLGGVAKIQASTDGSSWQDLRTVTATGHSWLLLWIDLSAFDGAASFQLRFTWTDNGQWAAGFAVDDVCVYERDTNDLALVDAFMADIMPDGFDDTQRSLVYRQIPVQQCDASTLTVSAVVLNRGTSALTDVSVTADAVVGGTQLAINTSIAIPSLAPGERDTLMIDLGWSPDTPGYVVFHWNAQSIGAEDLPANQAWIDSLRVTDAGFENGNHQMAVDRNSDDGSLGLDGDKFSAGNRFELEGTGQTILGIHVRYDEATEEGAQVRARLMDGLMNELAASEVLEVSADDLFIAWWTSGTVYIPFSEPYGPVTGDVFALIESLPDSGNMRVATSGASAHGASVLLKGLGEAIGWTSRTPMVRLAFSEPVTAVEEHLPVAGPLIAYPSPTSGSTTIVLPQGAGRARLTAMDAAGRTVMQWDIARGARTFIVEAGNWVEGTYLLRLATASGPCFGRLLVVH